MEEDIFSHTINIFQTCFKIRCIRPKAYLAYKSVALYCYFVVVFEWTLLTGLFDQILLVADKDRGPESQRIPPECRDTQ